MRNIVLRQPKTRNLGLILVVLRLSFIHRIDSRNHYFCLQGGDEIEHTLPCNVMFLDLRISLGWTYFECVYKKLTLVIVIKRTFMSTVPKKWDRLTNMKINLYYENGLDYWNNRQEQLLTPGGVAWPAWRPHATRFERSEQISRTENKVNSKFNPNLIGLLPNSGI